MLKNLNTRKHITNIYGLIWVQYYPVLQSELEGDTEYIKQ